MNNLQIPNPVIMENKKASVKTVLGMSLLSIGILSLMLISVPEVSELQLPSVGFWLLFIAVQILYFKLAFSDPGFLPKKEELLQESSVKSEPVHRSVEMGQVFNQSTKGYLGLVEDSPNKNNENNSEKSEDPNEIEEESQEDHSAQFASASISEIDMTMVRVCLNCHIEQPLRAKHCKDCDRCVPLHDHHCPYLGVCIGERNRRLFYCYLVCLTVLLWWAFVWSALSFALYESILQAVFYDSIRGILCLFIGFVATLVSILLGFHTYLGLHNITTWELLSWYKISYLKHFDKSKGSPFSGGYIKNIQVYCCEPFGTSAKEWTLPENNV